MSSCHDTAPRPAVAGDMAVLSVKGIFFVQHNFRHRPMTYRSPWIRLSRKPCNQTYWFFFIFGVLFFICANTVTYSDKAKWQRLWRRLLSSTPTISIAPKINTHTLIASSYELSKTSICFSGSPSLRLYRFVDIHFYVVVAQLAK